MEPNEAGYNAPEPHSKARIPDHELLCCVGRGSYGEVWLARNTLGRFRAVKIVFRAGLGGQSSIDREITGLKNFEPISRAHDGVVDILHVGRNEAEGYFFYVMEIGDDAKGGQAIDPENYIPKTLTKEIKIQGRLSFFDCLELGLRMSSALDHLHRNGLIHRDVKPSNIIYINGAAKLADIGLVTNIEDANSFVGTDGYIPPEGPRTPQADIYSLGKVLYEMNTGYDRKEFPILPPDFSKFPDAEQFLELNEIITKACHGEPEKRYKTAGEMHADLKVLQDGKSVQRLRILERRWAFLIKASQAAALVFLVIGVAGYEILRRKNEADEKRSRQAGAEVANGLRDMEQGNLLGAFPHFVEALKLDTHEEGREDLHRLRLGLAQAYSPKLTQMRFLDRRVNTIEFSADEGSLLGAEWWGLARLWDAGAPAAEPRSLEHGAGLLSAALSPDGSLIVTAGEDNNAIVWSRETSRELWRHSHSNKVYSARFSPGGKWIVTAGKDGAARIFEAATGKLLRELAAHTAPVHYAEFSADERWVATASQDNTARLWDAETGMPLGEPMPHKGWVYMASFSPDGSRLVTACLDRRARLWKLPSCEPVAAEMTHNDAVRSARFSPSGRQILTASWDSTARIWNGKSGLPARQNSIFHHSARLMDAAFNADGSQMVTACIDGTVRVFDLAANHFAPRLLPGVPSADGTHCAWISDGKILVQAVNSTNQASRVIQLPDAAVEAALNANGRYLMAAFSPAAGPNAGKPLLQVWNAMSGEAVSQPIENTNSLARVRLSLDGRRLVISDGKTAHLHHTQTGKTFDIGSDGGGVVTNMVFDADAEKLAMVDNELVSVWSAETGRQLFPPLRHRGQASFVQFGPDEELITCSKDNNLNEHFARVWNARTGAPISPPLKHRDGILGAALSPDGRLAVTTSEDGTAVVWNVRTGTPATPPLPHEHRVWAACFSPDGRWVATGTARGMVQLWDARSGEALSPPMPHNVSVRSISISSDGGALTTISAEGEGWRWELPREKKGLKDLAAWSELFSENWAGAKGQLRASWASAAAQPEAAASANAESRFAWHLREAEAAEEDDHWNAMRFHLRQISRHISADPLLNQRKEALILIEAQLKPGISRQ